MTLKLKNFHERDKRIIFDEQPHIYYVDGEAYKTSVTKFIHSFFSKFDAEEIISKYYNKWQQNPNNKYFGMSPEEIKQSWEDLGKRESEKGTILHKDIENFYNGLKVTNYTKEYKLFIKYFNEHKNLEAFRTEWEIFDEQLKLAGSIDICYIDKNSGNFILADWKRSKEIKMNNYWQKGKFPVNKLDDCNYYHYSLQLNIYRLLLKKNYGLDIKDMFLVRLHPNTDFYEKIPVEFLEEEAQMLLDFRLKQLSEQKKEIIENII